MLLFTEEPTRMVSKLKQEQSDGQNKKTGNYEKLKELDKKYGALKKQHHDLVDEKTRLLVRIQEKDKKIKEQDVRIKELQQQLKYPEYVELSDWVILSS